MAETNAGDRGPITKLGAMNLVVLLGRLTRDFDARHAGPNKELVARSAIAVTTHMRRPDGSPHSETMFIDLEAWGTLAELLTRNLGKGDPIMVHGRLRLNEWTDKTTQQKHRGHVVRIERWMNIRQLDELPSEAAVESDSILWPEDDG